MTEVRRGDVCIARLDPTQGSEQRKTRPVVIVQNDIDNVFSPILIAVPVTSRGAGKEYPTEVRLEPPEGGLSRGGVILCNQVRALDKSRLVRRMGRLTQETMRQVDEALKAALGLE